MTVLINEVEVVVEPSSAPAGDAPPETEVESAEAASGTPLSGADMRSVILHLSDRAERLRAH